jgi:hypothetical protein
MGEKIKLLASIKRMKNKINQSQQQKDRQNSSSASQVRTLHPADKSGADFGKDLAYSHKETSSDETPEDICKLCKKNIKREFKN